MPENFVQISQPVHQHSYEAVRAAQDRGYLERFTTSIYATGSGIFDPNLHRRLPARLESYITSQLRRRQSAGIDPTLVETHPLGHLIAFAARPILPAKGAAAVEDWAHRRFDRKVAGGLRKAGRAAAVVHAFEGSALETLIAAKELGSTAVLDVPIAYERARDATLAEDPGSHGASRFGTRHHDLLRREREVADVLLAPSEFVQRCLLEAGVGAQKIRLLPYGVDAERFHPAVREVGRPFTAVFVGQVVARKGVRILLEAWSQLPDGFGELRIVGPADPYGRALLAKYTHNVRYLGQVPKEQAHLAMADADVFVFPSLAEGSALVTYEAMALGLPVITTESSGSVVRHEQEGLVVEADPRAVQAALVRVHQDAELRLRLGSSARRRILESYTWGHYRERLADLYVELVG
jgi:glycosyltransferase involved in cell wall biosynthesis